MTNTIKPTASWLRLLFLITGQVEKIVLDYNAGKNNHQFSNKVKDEHK